ncbi:MAG: alginate export family protein [Nitrospiraceae bacterium]|nr:alginate export family protein [Nitrospirota bacterium]MDA8339648.1 alginate export family protein [Nitrospiraceae bacterium]
MRKFLAIFASLVLVLGFAASAFAIQAEIPSETQATVAKGTTQITLGGAIRVRGEVLQNTTDFDKNKSDYKAYYDQRVRLRLQADVTKNTMGVIHLESGDTSAKSDYTWGTETGEGKGVYYNVGNGKQSSLHILEAWILHKGSGLLGIPAGIKVGHQPLRLGNGLFFDHSKFGDDAIVFFMDPTKELHIGLLTAKFSEGPSGTSKNDDANAYVGLLIYKPSKDTNIGFDVTYVDDQRSTGLGGIVTGNVSIPTHLWNFGLRGDTNVSGLGIKADIELQTGKIAYDKVTGGTETKLKGYAYLLGLSYKLDPVKLSLDYAYGSGDKIDTANKNEGFITALSGLQNYTYVYDYRASTSVATRSTGLSNTWYVKLGGNADVTKDLNADLNIYYLRAAKKMSNTYDSKKIGTEVDAKLTYKIDKNLVYWVEGGYLFAGNLYKNFTTSATKNVDDAYAVRHGIELSF